MFANRKGFFRNYLNLMPYCFDKIFHFLLITMIKKEAWIVTCRMSTIQGKQCIIVYNLCIILNVSIFINIIHFVLFYNKTHGLLFHADCLACNFMTKCILVYSRPVRTE